MNQKAINKLQETRAMIKQIPLEFLSDYIRKIRAMELECDHLMPDDCSAFNSKQICKICGFKAS